MSKVQEVFRHALQETPQYSKPILDFKFGASHSQTYKKFFHNALNSTLGWAIITSVMTFILLYALNPPIVQQNKNDHDLVKPSPNVYIILVLSLLAGGGVLILVKYSLAPSGLSSFFNTNGHGALKTPQVSSSAARN